MDPLALARRPLAWLLERLARVWQRAADQPTALDRAPNEPPRIPRA